MANPIKPAVLEFPLKGIDLSRAFVRQNKLTTPRAVNVRAFEPLTGRSRGGSRSGITRWIDERVNGAELVQHLNVVISVRDEAMIGNWDWEDDYFVDGDGGIANPQTGGYIRSGGSGTNPGKKKTPLIVWANPANVEVDGMSGLFELTLTELNAVVKDPITLDIITLDGLVTYSPSVAASLSPGLHQSLRVTWDPGFSGLAARTYRPARKRVFINVLPAGGGGVETWTFVGLVVSGGAAFNGVVVDVTATSSLGDNNTFQTEVIAPFPPAEPGGNFLIGNSYPLSATDNTDPFGGVLSFA